MTAYRYTLHRSCPTVLAPSGHRLCFVMFNPSTADDRINDQTIRRCIGFTRSNLFAEMEVVNLFAARATHPRELLLVDDPVGPENDEHTGEAIARADAVVFAWGATRLAGLDVLGRAIAALGLCHRHNLTPLCLGTTKNGSPHHPSRLSASQPLEEWK